MRYIKYSLICILLVFVSCSVVSKFADFAEGSNSDLQTTVEKKSETVIKRTQVKSAYDSPVKGVSYKKAQKKNSAIYAWLRRHIPFLRPKNKGRLKILDKYRRVRSIFNYKNGLLNGLAIGYYKNKRVKWVAYYYNGKKHGVQTLYYPEGTVYCKTPFVRGKITGTIRQYDKNGHLRYKIPCRGNLISGKILKFIPGTYDIGKMDAKDEMIPAEAPEMTDIIPQKDFDYFLTSYDDNEVNHEYVRRNILTEKLSGIINKPSDIKLSYDIAQTENDNSCYIIDEESTIKKYGTDFESWKYNCLINNIDYEQVIYKGFD
jgi:antitoxin component YwqK of YwqJK toxin-antitoxin module